MSMYKEGREVEFEAIVERFLFTDLKTGESKYQVSPTAAYYTKVFTNRKGRTNIVGSLPELVTGGRYFFKTVTHVDPTYGPYYVVTNVDVAMPKNKKDKSTFLQKFINKDRADRIIEVYPDFINIVYRGEEVDVTPIHGVGEKTYEKLKKLIIKEFELFKLFQEFDGLIPFNFILLFKSKIDKGMSPKTIKTRLKKEPYKFLCSLKRVSFRKADELIVSIMKEHPENKIFKSDILESDERYKFAVEYFLTLESYRTGNTYFEINTVEAFLKKSVIGITEDKINDILYDKRFFVVSKNRKYISLKSMFTMEKEVNFSIERAIKLKPEEEYKVDLGKYREVGEFKMTDEQLSVIPLLMNNKISILNGYAGTGKTDTINNLIRFMDDKHITYRLMAPTGKAAKVLAKRTGSDASTIHVALECSITNEEDMDFKFNINRDNPFKEEVIIVDEASMIDTELMFHLLDGIDFFKTRLLLIGDDAQLPSVGPGNVFSVLKKHPDIENVELTKVFRFGKGGISTMATNARYGEMGLPEDEEVFISGDEKGGLYIFEEASMGEAVDEAINKYLDILYSGEDFENILLLTYKRKNTDKASAEAINPIIQSVVNYAESFIELKDKETKFKMHDYVMQTRNDYSAFVITKEEKEEIEFGGYLKGTLADENNVTTVTNGTTGRIVDVIDDGLVIDFIDIGWIYVPYEKVIDIELAYCITIHKSQGSQADNVIIISPRQHIFGMTSNLLYVAISRAKKNCFHYGNASTINKAATVKEHIDRKTTLENLILKKVEIMSL